MITPNFKKFNIEAYKPGKSKVKRLNKVIKLSANESALGMPKADSLAESLITLLSLLTFDLPGL